MDAMTSFDPARYLPDDLLARLRERAVVHDRENTFPHDDLDELRAAGYLGILVPESGAARASASSRPRCCSSVSPVRRPRRRSR